LIGAARPSGSGLDRRVDRRPAWAAFAFEGGAAAIALDGDLEDGCVVDEAIDEGQRHRLVGEDLSPFAERLVGGDQQGSPLVSGTDELEPDAGFGLILGDLGEVVEDQEVVLVEPGDGGFEGEFAAGDLPPLNEIGSSGEQNAPAVFDQGEAESCRQVTLGGAGRPEPDQIGPCPTRHRRRRGP